MIDFKEIVKKIEDGESVYLKVKTFPAAGRNCFLGLLEDGTLKLAIKAPAEKGKANFELVKYLAKELGLEKDLVEIISGKTARIKLIKIKVKN